jgi:hypothetical protein
LVLVEQFTRHYRGFKHTLEHQLIVQFTLYT